MSCRTISRRREPPDKTPAFAEYAIGELALPRFCVLPEWHIYSVWGVFIGREGCFFVFLGILAVWL